MTKLMLNMIVRNERERIERCLASVKDHISSWAILDTGSTDGTPEFIREYLKDIPGKLFDGTFDNFEQARNDALLAARMIRPFEKTVYLLLMDADMQLVVEDAHAFDNLDGVAYDMVQKSGTLHYDNCRLLRHDSGALYQGVTHEYLDVRTVGKIKGAHFVDHADGSNRKEKYKRDIALLIKAMNTETRPGMQARYWFYLGQSYRDAGEPQAAFNAYKKRIEMGGWDEEIWNAQVNAATCRKDMGDEAGFIREMLIAYNMRPSRAETLFDLAHYFRDKGINAPAAMFAEAGMALPRTHDSLFVSDWVYNCGLREEFAITGFYSKETRPRAFQVCNDLALDKTAYSSARELARTNLYHYLPKLSELCRSYTDREIAMLPPRGYVAMNPSVAGHGDLYCVVRTVNYKITEDGRYAIQGEDDSINDSNPIRTRNWLLRLNRGTLDTETVKEIMPPADLPEPAFKLVVGWEDMRLFRWKGSLWTSACVRELNAEGYCEQVLSRITEEGHHCRLDNVKRMLREPRAYEKNWMPMVNGNRLSFVYRLGELVDIHGKTCSTGQNPYDSGHISGGSQAIPFFNHWLAVVHEARIRPDNGQRYYQHRFVLMDTAGSVFSLSKPFVFHDKRIEFAAGLAWRDTKNLVISFGVQDKTAHIATVSAEEVRALCTLKL